MASDFPGHHYTPSSPTGMKTTKSSCFIFISSRQAPGLCIIYFSTPLSGGLRRCILLHTLHFLLFNGTTSGGNSESRMGLAIYPLCLSCLFLPREGEPELWHTFVFWRTPYHFNVAYLALVFNPYARYSTLRIIHYQPSFSLCVPLRVHLSSSCVLASKVARLRHLRMMV